MGTHRKLPLREQVFILSLRRHGYRLAHPHQPLKRRKRYVIPATWRDDSGGIDFWIKPAKCTHLIPVQITQRGTTLFRKYHHKASESQFADFVRTSLLRLREKRRICKKAGIAFVLVRDHDGRRPSRSLAWGDVKALYNGILPFMLQ